VPDEQTVGMKSRVHPKYKTKYRVTNWASYDRALVRRGDVTVWIDLNRKNVFSTVPWQWWSGGAAARFRY